MYKCLQVTLFRWSTVFSYLRQPNTAFFFFPGMSFQFVPFMKLIEFQLHVGTITFGILSGIVEYGECDEDEDE